ncbi:MAG TPA: SigE family RNA polymerase sigma factor [Actinomycetota bacterium]|jgi:RNA polymerase sigma-70 factor (sigma-E family)|nr:SigE family RNA polymerase sigma factor [Actinomycetota bacterium]
MRTESRDAEFRSFYLAQAGQIRQLALFLTGDVGAADELSQEALLRAYRHWHRIRKDDPAPYVRRIVVNLHRNRIRRAIVERRHQPVPTEPSRERTPEVDQALRVAHALRRLSPIRKATIALRFYEDLSEAEIARVLDRPIGTVKSDIHRALRQLRPLLEDDVRETT